VGLRRKTEAVLAGALLLLVSPLLLIIAAGIWISDPGPVFYVADRSGLHSRIFRMYKFRTMRTGGRAGTGGGNRITVAGDARVFPFGALLRRLKMDELPQLLNIVRGEMAFVGPRPEDPWFVEHAYTAADRETLEVLPGLTSPGTLYYFTEAEWSLNGDASYMSGPLKVKLQLDRDYVAKATAAGDLRLIGKTVWVLVTRRR
jgi:lipopolysaccharide/colanic/teichoic acid biosynthesis glycosyltransferase